MADPTQDILAAALSLPERERLKVASEPLASVEEPYDDAWNAAWIEEIERREQAVRDGGSEGTRGLKRFQLKGARAREKEQIGVFASLRLCVEISLSSHEVDPWQDF
ncbi:addiction module protein [Sorangium cellulosum]|uniref:addiction module protein n=1 Tax=Sorangium cellulosum TaxID=56 RepID=UPI003D9AA8BC